MVADTAGEVLRIRWWFCAVFSIENLNGDVTCFLFLLLEVMDILVVTAWEVMRICEVVCRYSAQQH